MILDLFSTSREFLGNVCVSSFSIFKELHYFQTNFLQQVDSLGMFVFIIFSIFKESHYL